MIRQRKKMAMKKGGRIAMKKKGGKIAMKNGGKVMSVVAAKKLLESKGFTVTKKKKK